MAQRAAFAASGNKQERPAATEKPFLDGLWHLFCSPKVALILILGIALASLAGALLMQAPASVRSDSLAYFQWLQDAEGKYGGFWTKLFHWTKLFYVFDSFWFKGLILLLITNIVVCSINRWKSVWHSVTFRRVVMAPSFYTTGSGRFALTFRNPQVSSQLAVGSLSKALTAFGYRVVKEKRDGVDFLYGDRFRLNRLGTYATHLSIVLLLLGALTEGLGFREQAFVVAEGSTREVGHGTGLSIYVEDFTDEWYLNDTPKDYRSEVALFENGTLVKQQTIRVNEPLVHNGVRFHQAFYGPAVVMEVKDRGGNVLFNDAVALPWRTKAETKARQRPLGSFVIPVRNLTVYPVLTSGPEDGLIEPGQALVEIYASSSSSRPVFSEMLDLKRPKVVGDLEFTFIRERQFTGLQVVKAPGAPLIWVGAFLLILGNVAVLFFPPRQIWARGLSVDGERTSLEVRALAARDQSLDNELQRVKERVETLLPSTAKVEIALDTKRRKPKRSLSSPVALRGGRK